MEIRRLGAHDELALRAFSCYASAAEPWLRIVEEMINEHLADALAGGYVSAIGLWNDQTLCALQVWRPDERLPHIWHSSVLAVAVGYRRRGIGRALKEHVIALAREAGVHTLTSTVHEENEPMLRLNRQLGADIERSYAEPEHFEVVISISREP